MKFTIATSLLLCALASDVAAFQIATSGVHQTTSYQSERYQRALLPTNAFQTESTSTKMAASFSRDLVLSMASDFGSDFGSAMPPKPELSLEDKMRESGQQFVDTMTQCLGEGVEAPPELIALEKSLEAKAQPEEMALRIYELMIERGMLYDEAPETGTLTPTEFDIKANLDVKEVKEEFAYLYKYGMTLMERNLLTEDQAKTAVMDRLIARTGLEPEAFDKWLGY